MAEEMRLALRTANPQPKEGTRIAIQPLHPSYFAALNGRQRRQLYNWLLTAFRKEVLGNYRLVSRDVLEAIAREIESSGESDWFEQFRQVLREAHDTPVTIQCASAPRGARGSSRTYSRDAAFIG